ncbi:MAG: class I SAM-dependent rRNA methyltransferase [Paludibacteraceae bacterium]|nr:class I SAM-dependent rRNA methyltransferase [Paludibacteraceae bacterium]
MTTVILNKHKEESVLRFHPWIFSGAIRKVVLDKDHRGDAPEEGELVVVQSSEGQTLGVGHWQVGSIAVRILEFFTDHLPDNFWEKSLSFANGLRKSARLSREDNNTYRLVHGEGDFLPGLVIDIYDDTAVLQAHSVGMHKHRMEIAEAICRVVPEVKNVYYKSEGTLPYKAPIPEDERKDRYLIGQTTSCLAMENGLTFGIDWLRGQKTGFFVDQRENRALVEQYARNKTVLNMFCYTGGFSVYALRGGAKLVHSVDSSAKAIELVNENVARNFPGCKNHEAFVDDAFHFLDHAENKYDLIILDPPAFAKHRDAVKHALQGYKRLNAKAFEMIKEGGLLFTFSCSQAIDKDMFRLAVFSAAAMSGRKVRILHQLHQPQDHPISIYHPEGEYLKGLVLWVE